MDWGYVERGAKQPFSHGEKLGLTRQDVLKTIAKYGIDL
jgi:hypothetical protein